MDVDRAWWDERAALHGQDRVYDTQAFLAGASTLYDLDREVMGDVSGLDLLHLQCHTGLDTLSLLRAGARTVTGVDFSPVRGRQGRRDGPDRRAGGPRHGHSLGEVVTSAASAGLVVEQLGEDVAVESDVGRGLLPRDADGLLRWRRDGELLPVLFSLRARRPGPEEPAPVPGRAHTATAAAARPEPGQSGAAP